MQFEEKGSDLNFWILKQVTILFRAKRHTIPDYNHQTSAQLGSISALSPTRNRYSILARVSWNGLEDMEKWACWILVLTGYASMWVLNGEVWRFWKWSLTLRVREDVCWRLAFKYLDFFISGCGISLLLHQDDISNMGWGGLNLLAKRQCECPLYLQVPVTNLGGQILVVGYWEGRLMEVIAKGEAGFPDHSWGENLYNTNKTRTSPIIPPKNVQPQIYVRKHNRKNSWKSEYFFKNKLTSGVFIGIFFL